VGWGHLVQLVVHTVAAAQLPCQSVPQVHGLRTAGGGKAAGCGVGGRHGGEPAVVVELLPFLNTQRG
jgi:hypothetical protein